MQVGWVYARLWLGFSSVPHMFSSGAQAARNGCLGHSLSIAGPWGSKVKSSHANGCEGSAYVMPPNITLAKAGLTAKPNITRSEKYTLTTVRRRGRNEFFFLDSPNYYMYSAVYPTELIQDQNENSESPHEKTVLLPDVTLI